MVPEAQRLCAVFVAAMPSYVTALCAERGYPLDRRTVESIEEAAATLDAALTTELERDFRRSAEALSSSRELRWRPVSGRCPSGRHPVDPTGRGSADDPYGLVPGSSIDLGQEAHEAHLQWGVAKAGEFRGRRAPKVAKPAVAVMASDRADRVWARVFGGGTRHDLCRGSQPRWRRSRSRIRGDDGGGR